MNDTLKIETSGRWQLCEQKSLLIREVNKEIGRLIQADRKAIITQIAILYYSDELKHPK